MEALQIGAYDVIAREMLSVGLLVEHLLTGRLYEMVAEVTNSAGMVGGFNPAGIKATLHPRACYWRGRILEQIAAPLPPGPKVVDAVTGGDGNQRNALVAQLDQHVGKAKRTGIGFPSRAAFVRSLRNGRGIPYRDFCRWRKGQKVTPGYPPIIESAIEKLKV